MNWYKLALNVKKKFVGTCVTGLNNDFFQNNIAQDATELAQLIENSQPITLSQFLESCDVDLNLKTKILKNKNTFEAGQSNNIIWLWNKNSDIHYFYL